MNHKKYFLIFLCGLFSVTCEDTYVPIASLEMAVYPPEGGTAKPESDKYVYGQEITFEAIPNEGWVFHKWESVPGYLMTWREVRVQTRPISRRNTVTAYFLEDPVVETTEVVDVTNPITGRTWMDRNLGATRVAESWDDVEAIGALFQWGREADGHQKWSSKSSRIRSLTSPGHGHFITSPSDEFTWTLNIYNDLWQGKNGINNPCPEGYYVPTAEEWREEYHTWEVSKNGHLEGFKSVLKLPAPHYRQHMDGELSRIGHNRGHYWTSTISGDHDAYYLSIAKSPSIVISSVQVGFTTNRAHGMAVRCIKMT